ncbi:MAG: hypothetical protein AUJ92_12275 [Armatimonadetes bacterium CG2_30_59_28]|nr:response regulator [Armatimonadota bacterium]OIO93513.1 MAG: hypothetical protein AUJ92_12275 [Armatimonadetes bacterium CG2_30_59_28]PIU60338.1 MAG: two-component system response regulator [Armatimonadetes bacterium CG07_land_8_20_14_0_80_59_28]PIX38361.1 MAG: two-component system response regulator [Armatimonadetes bacterium CG_4_8_14_3_um_filter_58_9]PIY43719.1 MAG: two-component system response regulator [Armatimonadetes bacterium CG_4_10_14_3_um_filter_59_10]
MESCDPLPTTPPKVLIVDDDPAIVELLSGFLRLEEYQILTAVDGAEAVSTAVTQLPDLILLDINLPKLNGYEVCRWLRAEEITRSIPIIIITGHLDFSNREAALEAGANELLTKPIRCEELLTRMRDLLQHDQPAASMERR